MKVLVMCRSLVTFKRIIYDKADGQMLTKHSQTEYTLNGIRYKFIVSERDLRGIRDIERVEYWYGFEMREDYDRLMDCINECIKLGYIKN